MTNKTEQAIAIWDAMLPTGASGPKFVEALAVAGLLADPEAKETGDETAALIAESRRTISEMGSWYGIDWEGQPLTGAERRKRLVAAQFAHTATTNALESLAAVALAVPEANDRCAHVWRQEGEIVACERCGRRIYGSIAAVPSVSTETEGEN